MPSFRHVLADNHWEIQCPECGQFVRASKQVFEGAWPLPAHSRWAPSWAHLLIERWPASVRRRWLVRGAIGLEGLVRLVTRRLEPRCAYREVYHWGRHWPTSGFSPGGPL